MTWKGERRKQLPSNWGAIRKLVLERDGYRCTANAEPFEVHPENFHAAGAKLAAGDTLAAQRLVLESQRCPARATDVDHANGPHDHRLSSLRSLCDWHHKQKTQAEAKAAQALKSRARPKAKHPGLR